MLLPGSWHLCDDGIIRPVLRGEVLAADGSWVQLPFLVDTAADRTVFSADILAILHLSTTAPPTPLRGVGGAATSVLVQTQIQLTRDEGGQISLQGHYAAFRIRSRST